MRRILWTAMLVGCASLSSPAAAEELYDLNRLRYEPKAVALPECRVGIELDPTWTFAARVKQTDRYPTYYYDFKSNPQANSRPFDAFAFMPLLNGFVNCHVSVDKDGQQRKGETLKQHTKTFADRIRALRLEKADYINVSEVAATQIAGLDLAYIFSAEIPPKPGSEFVSGGVTFWLYGTKDDILVHAWIRLADPVGGKHRVARGTTARGNDKGKTMTVRMANDATLVDKVYYGSRTLEQDRDYVLTILRSMR